MFPFELYRARVGSIDTPGPSRLWHRVAVLGLGLCLGFASPARADVKCDANGICTQESPIIAGDPVPIDHQRALNLVTVGGGCSGTLLNRSWVLTADHCVTNNGKIGGPANALSSLSVKAAWSSLTAIPTRMVRYSPGLDRDPDVALLFLGLGDLGPVAIQALHAAPPTAQMNFTAYGRGIFGYAAGSQPSQRDGQYRTAGFSIRSVGDHIYNYVSNNAAQIIAGGDSGGPDIVNANGVNAILGVHSRCHGVTYVAGKAETWDWATNISDCTTASIHALRPQIETAIREVAPVTKVTMGSNAAISRIPGGMEHWWIAPNGAVEGAYWPDSTGKWGRYQLAAPGRAAPQGDITALSRHPEAMEAWWIGTQWFGAGRALVR